MKVIISHDVDHLYASDHWFKDLIFPKLWTRSLMEMLKHQIELKEFILRIGQSFHKEINNIKVIADYDIKNNVNSTFFFGMDKCLGMNYTKEKALHYIRYLLEKGLDTGVHGCNYENSQNISDEYNSFKKLTGLNEFGIRMHYIRYNEETFKKLSQAGYIFDTSEFNKQQGFLIKKPYEIGEMWEFPLTLMDSYLPPLLSGKKEMTKQVIDSAYSSGMNYITILFHDVFFSKAYQASYQWYLWLIEYLRHNKFEFISYKNAIKELEKRADF